MNALIVYDSQFGNTRKIADAIAETLDARAVPIREFNQAMLEGVSLLVVGSPIQGWRPTATTVATLLALPAGALRNTSVAAFDTRFKTIFSGNAARKIRSLLVKHGGRPIAPPEAFIVTGKEGPLADGELEHARKWALGMREQIGVGEATLV